MAKVHTLASLVAQAEQENSRISDVVLKQQAEQMELTPDEVFQEMEHRLDVMIESIDEGLQTGVRSTSGLTGGTAYQLKTKVEKEGSLAGNFFAKAVMKALAVSELNAAMGRIVAAPTAGSCGIVPAAIMTMMEEKGASKENCVMALFTTSAIGEVIAEVASLAGAEGGCQAECGAASSMAAAALVELAGGTPRMAEHAAAIAMKNLLGLVCDPVAGLVEIPCTKRNAGGISNAICAAELALAGIESAIPADEVFVVMKQVGDTMPCSLKETADGGLATTPTGKRLLEQVFGKQG